MPALQTTLRAKQEGSRAGLSDEPKPLLNRPTGTNTDPLDEDVRTILGKSHSVLCCDTLNPRRPRQQSPPVPVRLAVTSQSSSSEADSIIPPGSRSPARGPYGLATEFYDSRDSQSDQPPPKSSPRRPSFLIPAIRRLVGLPPCTVHLPSLALSASTAAARQNWDLLRAKGYSLSRLLGDQPFSALAMGSEFRPVPELKILMGMTPFGDIGRKASQRGLLPVVRVHLESKFFAPH
jgi:hypothetical protein